MDIERAYILTPQGTFLRTIGGTVIDTDAPFYDWMIDEGRDAGGRPVCPCCGRALTTFQREKRAKERDLGADVLDVPYLNFRHVQREPHQYCFYALAKAYQPTPDFSAFNLSPEEKSHASFLWKIQRETIFFLAENVSFSATEINANEAALCAWDARYPRTRGETFAYLMYELTGHEDLSPAMGERAVMCKRLLLSAEGLDKKPWMEPYLCAFLMGAQRRPKTKEHGNYRNKYRWEYEGGSLFNGGDLLHASSSLFLRRFFVHSRHAEPVRDIDTKEPKGTPVSAAFVRGIFERDWRKSKRGYHNMRLGQRTLAAYPS